MSTFPFVSTKRLRVLLLLVLFGFLLLTRFYEMEQRNQFTWDQLNNAWAAKTIIDDKRIPLVGMQAKLNSGIYIGPLYYYLITPVYFMFDLDPIASGYIAGVTSILTFLVLFIVIKRLFNEGTAFISVFLYTVTITYIQADRIQWPVNFIPLISLLVFYSLTNVFQRKYLHLLYLGIWIGLSFHIHLTSIFYPLFIIAALPFFPRTKQTLLFGGLGILSVITLISPLLYYHLISQATATGTLYAQSIYHGLHLRRMLQLSSDAFIELGNFTVFPIFSFFRFLILPLFIFAYVRKKRTREKLLVVYLLLIWFIVPWIVFSTYSGDLTGYYFSLTRLLSIAVVSYLLYKLFTIHLMLKVLVVILLGIYGYANISQYLSTRYEGIEFYRNRTLKRIDKGEQIEFVEGAPESYFYYIYTRK